MPLPELGGGNIVIFQHARLLQCQGVDVTVLAEGELPPWSNYDGPYLDYSREPLRLESQDLVIATYYPTVRRALELNAGPVAHFCQGYEGHLDHLSGQIGEIEAAYSQRLPMFAVTPHLADFVSQRFGRHARVVSPAVGSSFRPRWRRWPRTRPWIAVPGAFEAPMKGVRTTLAAVAELRRRGLDCRMLRFSPVAQSSEERSLVYADRYLCAVSPQRVARELRACDLMLFGSQPTEGFGLPVLEALASGVPVVAFGIPSLRFMAEEGVLSLKERSTEAMATAAQELLAAPRSWRLMRERGARAARRFAEPVIATELAEAVEWAIERSR